MRIRAIDTQLTLKIKMSPTKKFESPSLIEADKRSLFLILVNEFEPQVLRDLHSTAFPLFEEIRSHPRVKDLGHQVELYDEKTMLAALPSLSEPIKGLFDELRSWSSRWNLRSQWVIDAGYRTLWKFHHRDMNGIDSLEWASIPASFSVPSSTEGPPFYFGFRGWNLQTEGRTRFASLAKKAFVESLKVYMDAATESLERSGYKANASAPERERNYIWLIMFNVKKMSYAKIEVEYPKINRQLQQLRAQNTGKTLDCTVDEIFERDTIRNSIASVSKDLKIRKRTVKGESGAEIDS